MRFPGEQFPGEGSEDPSRLSCLCTAAILLDASAADTAQGVHAVAHAAAHVGAHEAAHAAAHEAAQGQHVAQCQMPGGESAPIHTRGDVSSNDKK